MAVNGNGHKPNGRKKLQPKGDRLTPLQISQIVQAVIFGQMTQNQLAEEFKCHPRTIARVVATIPDTNIVKDLSSKANVIEDCLTRFLNASTEAAITAIEFASRPEQLAKYTPAERLNLFAAASDRIQFLAIAAERARVKKQGLEEQDAGRPQLPPADRCVEDESGVEAGAGDGSGSVVEGDCAEDLH